MKSRKSTMPAPEELPEIVRDPLESAKSAGLRYVTDARPGIRRIKRISGFRYVDTVRKPVRDAETMERIKSLVIPPAWTEVWICPLANGHLQATGRDARGRKQSRYHPHWRATRDETKYQHMIAFGALPAIRSRVEDDLTLPGLPRLKVLAVLVRLMETTFIRVGNVEYARENKSYGLTTMRNRHAKVHGRTITFDFAGKSGVHHTICVENKRLAKIVKQCQDLPGYELFQYLDEEGARHSVDSADVNEYLHEMTGQHFTAKDFRTWAGSVLAAMLLREFEPWESQTQAKRNVVAAIKAVSERLGNTPSVCRRCYVHPEVLTRYMDGAMMKEVEAAVEQEVDQQLQTLKDEEHALLRMLTPRTAGSR